MNERIKQLAEQAAISCGYFIGPRLYMTHEKEMEKFAELIAKECADIVEHSRIEGDEGVCLVAATKCKIKQHFGVEE
jgi:hypothetical protein